jgi:3-hydroxybutyryl-CoA dehydrogenase
MQPELAQRSYKPPAVRGFCRVLNELIARGRTGVMAGAGFYAWGGASPEQLLRERDRRLVALKQSLRKIGPLQGQGGNGV